MAKIADLLAAGPTLSFEFSAPRDPAGNERLERAMERLARLRPSFMSVTYGAGGTTRGPTAEVVSRIQHGLHITAMPHLTCVCHSEREIEEILERYAAAGISNILALGGDVPASMGSHDRSKDAFRHAADLVRFIRKFNERGRHPDKRGFGIGVAGFPEGHPSTPNRVKELDYLKAKVDEGADYIVTQLFFDNHDFYDFRDRCGLVGVHIPIIAGIMPVTSVGGMMRMADLAAGARFPAPLLRALNRAGGDADGVRRVGVHWATEQCRDLLDRNVKGIHFYTLNRSTATREIYLNLGVKDSLGFMPHMTRPRR